LINPKYDAQVKTKLTRASDLSVMDAEEISSEIENILKKNNDYLLDLLDRFEKYRKSLHNKKINSVTSSKKRGKTEITNLKDCLNEHGELIIGEGASAISGLVEVRDPKKHALLPLRGVVPNAEKKEISKLLQNKEVKEIISALGCGIDPFCDVSKLRYSKVILAADADPAGEWITTLLIVLFAKLTPELIKKSKLFICKTPLFGTGEEDKFKPIWSPKELEEARKTNKHIRRFKGLGEFQPTELKRFTLDEKERRLIQLEWTDKIDRIFDLMESSQEKRKLILGEWE
jgi:DNA gyrase/topoisomerase IV subunit B